MASLRTLLACILASTALAQINPKRQHQVLDIRYESSCEQYFNNTHQILTYKAHMDCAVNNGKFVQVCAELPRNWRWESLYGYLYMDLYNKEGGTMSDRLNTSRVAPGQVPAKCLTVNSWPGGDLFIKVQSNNFRPVYFTLSVVVSPTPIPTVRNYPAINSQIFPAKRSGPLNIFTDTTRCKIGVDTNGNYLMAMMFLTNNAEKLEVDHSLEARIDICSSSQTNMRVAVQGKNGAYTFYICSSTPCDPDSTSTIVSQNTPLVMSYGLATVPDHLNSIYVLVTAFSGKADPPGSNKYYGNFFLGLDFYP